MEHQKRVIYLTFNIKLSVGCIDCLHGRKWKKNTAIRAAETIKRSNPRPSRQTRGRGTIINVDDANDLATWLIPDEDVDDESYDEEDLIPPHARLRPRVHRGRGTR